MRNYVTKALAQPFYLRGAKAFLYVINGLCHCGAGVRWTPLRSRSTDRAGRRDRRKACGNPFSPRPSLRSRVNGCGNPFFFLRILRILSRLPLLRCPKVVIRLEREQLLTAALPFARFILHCRRSQRHSE